MEDYDIELKKLARFASESLSTKKMWTNRFIVGLRDEIQEFFLAHNPPAYASALWFDILMDMHCVKDKSINTTSSLPTISG